MGSLAWPLTDGSFHYTYNAQAIVDADHQVIVATTLTNIAADVEQVVPMIEKLHATMGTLPAEVLVDAGYCSAANLDYAKTVEAASDGRTEFFIATGRVKYGERVPDVSRGRIPADATLGERMARELKTKKGVSAYSGGRANIGHFSHCRSTVPGLGRNRSSALTGRGRVRAWSRPLLSGRPPSNQAGVLRRTERHGRNWASGFLYFGCDVRNSRKVRWPL